MLKRTEMAIGIVMVAIVSSGIVWFNISPDWTYLFQAVPENAAPLNPADQSEDDTVADTDAGDRAKNTISIQAVFQLAYVVLGAALTALALFVALVDFLLHRQQGKSFFTVNPTHARYQHPDRG